MRQMHTVGTEISSSASSVSERSKARLAVDPRRFGSIPPGGWRRRTGYEHRRGWPRSRSSYRIEKCGEWPADYSVKENSPTMQCGSSAGTHGVQQFGVSCTDNQYRAFRSQSGHTSSSTSGDRTDDFPTVRSTEAEKFLSSLCDIQSADRMRGRWRNRARNRV
jgi:hypothetical protein